jgi:TonB family protein
MRNRAVVLLVLVPVMCIAQPPQILSKTEPTYSEEARSAGVNATVAVNLTVGADGLPEDVHVLRGAGFGLDETAVETVRKWRFQPALKTGAAVRMRSAVEIDFRLQDPDREGQGASLEFVLPSGGERPRLVSGRIPANPEGVGPDKIRLAFSVDVEGIPNSLSVLEASSGQWAAQAMREIAGWQFVPGTVNGQPTEMKGIFELKRHAGAPSAVGVGYEASMVSIRSGEPQDSTLAAARLLSPGDRAEFNTFPRRTAFRWAPVAGAASYILEWDYGYSGVWHTEAEKTTGAGFMVMGTEYSFDFVGAQPGRWRVWAVNPEGTRGAPSKWRTFKYTR